MWPFLFGVTMFSHFLIVCKFGIEIRIYGVYHLYIRLIVRFGNIFDSVNRSFQLSKSFIPPIVLFKFENVFFLNGTFGISLSGLFLIMEGSIFLMASSVLWLLISARKVLSFWLELAYTPLSSHLMLLRV